MNGQAGKGSRQRPCLVSREEYEKNWNRIFGDKEKVETPSGDRHEEDREDREAGVSH
jgi:hypothetical protein